MDPGACATSDAIPFSPGTNLGQMGGVFGCFGVFFEAWPHRPETAWKLGFSRPEATFRGCPKRLVVPLGGGRSIQLSYEGNGGILAWIGTPGRRGGVGPQASAC